MLRALSSFFGNKDSATKSPLLGINSPDEDYVPNRFFNHFQLHDMPDEVSQVKLIDERRLVAAVTRYLVLLDIKYGRNCQTLEVHNSRIKLMEVMTLPCGLVVVAVDQNNLIAITSVSSSNELKLEKFLLMQEIDNTVTTASVISHVQDISTHHDAGFLCGSKSIKLISYQDKPREICDRFMTTQCHLQAREEVIAVLDSKLYTVCITGKETETLSKSKQDGKLKLKTSSFHTPPQLSANDALKSATLLSDSQWAVCSRHGYLFWFKTASNRDKPEGFLLLKLPERNYVECIDKVDEKQVAVVVASTVYVVDIEVRSVVYQISCSSSILSVHLFRSDLLVTLQARRVNGDGHSTPQVVTWNLHGKKASAKSAESDSDQPLPCMGSVIIHDGIVEGLRTFNEGLITYDTDKVLIISRNTEELAEKRFSHLKQLAAELEEF